MRRFFFNICALFCSLFFFQQPLAAEINSTFIPEGYEFSCDAWQPTIRKEGVEIKIKNPCLIHREDPYISLKLLGDIIFEESKQDNQGLLKVTGGLEIESAVIAEKFYIHSPLTIHFVTNDNKTLESMDICLDSGYVAIQEDHRIELMTYDKILFNIDFIEMNKKSISCSFQHEIKNLKFPEYHGKYLQLYKKLFGPSKGLNKLGEVNIALSGECKLPTLKVLEELVVLFQKNRGECIRQIFEEGYSISFYPIKGSDNFTTSEGALFIKTKENNGLLSTSLSFQNSALISHHYSAYLRDFIDDLKNSLEYGNLMGYNAQVSAKLKEFLRLEGDKVKTLIPHFEDFGQVDSDFEIVINWEKAGDIRNAIFLWDFNIGKLEAGWTSELEWQNPFTTREVARIKALLRNHELLFCGLMDTYSKFRSYYQEAFPLETNPFPHPEELSKQREQLLQMFAVDPNDKDMRVDFQIDLNALK